MAKTPKKNEPEPEDEREEEREQEADKRREPPKPGEPQPAAAPSAEDIKTEQDKNPQQPVNPPVEPEKATLVEVGQHEPYPTGSPPDPNEVFEKAHGYKRKEGE